jgi:hypothetical protein
MREPFPRPVNDGSERVARSALSSFLEGFDCIKSRMHLLMRYLAYTVI